MPQNKDVIIDLLQRGKYRDMKDVLNCFCCLFHYTRDPCMGGKDCAAGIRLFMEAEVGSVKER